MWRSTAVLPDELILAVFPSRKLLTKALDYLMEHKTVEIDHAAIVAKAANGEIVVLDDEIGPDEAAIAGSTLGAAISALGIAQFGALALPGIGPIIAIGASVLVGSLVGGVTGRFAASLLDAGYRNEQIEHLAKELRADHPALILAVRDPKSALPILKETLQRFRVEQVERLRASR